MSYQEDSEDESDDIRLVGGITKNKDCSEYFTSLSVNGTRVKFKVDTGSQVNIIPWAVFKQLSNKPQLTTVKIRLVS